LGGWLDGRYLPSKDFPYGISGFEGGFSLGTGDGSVAYRAGFWGRAGVFGARSRVRTLLARDEGLFRAELHVGNTIMAPSRRHPYRSWKLSFGYHDRYDLDPVDPRYWTLGQTVNAGLTLGLETIGPRHSEKVELAYRRIVPSYQGAPPDYDWLHLTVNQDLDPLFGGLKASWRIAAGSAFNEVPREVQFDIAEESRLDALDRFYANDRGPLRETGHFLVAGGGGVRGYWDQAILGQRLLAASLEVSHAAYPVYFFGDVGRVEASGLGEPDQPWFYQYPLVGRTLADAGFGVRLGPLNAAFPIWLGTPDPDESPWRFRWQFSIGTFALPEAP